MIRCIVVASILSILSGVASAEVSAARTNLVLIMTDDQAAWSLGCYGNSEARSPNVDQLASQGVRFTQAFAASPVCSPSRATFYTGRVPSQHGIHDWIKNENMGERARYCLEGETTLSDILARNGYVCGLSGKWHLGDSIQPHAGYTYWFAMPQGGSKYNDADMVRDGKVIQTKGYLTDRITDGAIEFLDKHNNQPFFLNVEYNAPHSPWQGHPQELMDLYNDCPFDSIPKHPPHPWAAARIIQKLGQREPLQQYFASCTGVDRGVERILAHLDKLGVSENTLVVYTSDQGFNFGHHGLVGKGNASNPRNMYDTSLRIPMIFRHTGHLEQGRTSDLTVSAYDFLPTILAYLGLPPSPGRNLPGRSFAETLRGKPQPDWPDTIFAEYSQARMIRTHKYKYVHRCNGGPFELYDLQKDPGETTNLMEKLNDKPRLRKRRIVLRKKIYDWFQRYGEAGSDPVGQEFFPVED